VCVLELVCVLVLVMVEDFVELDELDEEVLVELDEEVLVELDELDEVVLVELETVEVVKVVEDVLLAVDDGLLAGEALLVEVV
jgi:hypothetical protein